MQIIVSIHPEIIQNKNLLAQQTTITSDFEMWGQMKFWDYMEDKERIEISWLEEGWL